MIVRVWRGWTTVDAADEYETLLLGEIVPGIISERTPGFFGIEVLRHDRADEVEFMTVMRFESLAAVRAFAGENYTAAFVPASARAILSRFEETSTHFQSRYGT